MAIALATEYAYAVPPNAAYPGGSFKDDSTGATGDGTPLDSQWANDFLGFFQALLAGAGMVATGAPDTAVASQYRDAMESLMWTPGDYKWCSYSTPGYRWLECNGLTVGNAASGATARANADTAALFAALWITAQIQDSAGATTGRGLSAAADFAANKRAVIPDWRGDTLRAWDHGRGVDPARALGTEQMDAFKAHTHSMTYDSYGEGSGGVTNANGLLSATADSLVEAGHVNTAGVIGSTGGTETRMRNGSAMLVIRY